MTDTPGELGYEALEEVRLQPGETVQVVPAGKHALLVDHNALVAQMPYGAQGIALFTGTDVYMISDAAGQYSADRHRFTDVERAVTVARLRAVTAIVENPQE